MIHARHDGCAERPEHDPVTAVQRGWLRTVLGLVAEVALAEDHGDDPADRRRGERRPRRESNLDLAAAGYVRAAKARRDGRRVVGDDDVVRLQQIGQPRAGHVPHPAGPVHVEKPGVAWALDGRGRGDHRPSLREPAPARAGGWGRTLSISATSSRATVAGAFSVDGSASGTAAACSGVAMSPGSNETTRTPIGPSSACQTRVRWSRAALLAP